MLMRRTMRVSYFIGILLTSALSCKWFSSSTSKSESAEADKSKHKAAFAFDENKYTETHCDENVGPGTVCFRKNDATEGKQAKLARGWLKNSTVACNYPCWDHAYDSYNRNVDTNGAEGQSLFEPEGSAACVANPGLNDPTCEVVGANQDIYKCSNISAHFQIKCQPATIDPIRLDPSTCNIEAPVVDCPTPTPNPSQTSASPSPSQSSVPTESPTSSGSPSSTPTSTTTIGSSNSPTATATATTTVAMSTSPTATATATTTVAASSSPTATATTTSGSPSPSP